MIPPKIIDQISLISQYAEDCDDWVTIKKEIMKSIPSQMRKLFSRRDPITKEQSPNEFDLAVIDYYYETTGIKLKIRTLDERRKFTNSR
jgi:hypothetical protein